LRFKGENQARLPIRILYKKCFKASKLTETTIESPVHNKAKNSNKKLTLTKTIVI